MQVEKLRTVDADTLLSTPLRKTLFIVDGLIPQGLSVLSGASKIGKSWLMLWLGMQVARGNPVWEFETHKCDVLYLCLEDTHVRIQNRLYQLTDEAPAELRIATTSYQIGNGLEQQIELTLKFNNGTHLWELVERKNAEDLHREEIPDFLFRLVSFIALRRTWQGTASQLLTEMDETEVTANVVTKLLARFSAEVLMPQGIEYRTKRTGTSRLIRLEMSDSGDGNDGEISI